MLKIFILKCYNIKLGWIEFLKLSVKRKSYKIKKLFIRLVKVSFISTFILSCSN